jgi:hypothetical protein
MIKLAAVTAMLVSLSACTHGSFASKKELESARFARQDLCCAQTMREINEKRYEAFGCGQSATYVYVDKKWQREGPIREGSGNPADKLKDCSK